LPFNGLKNRKINWIGYLKELKRIHRVSPLRDIFDAFVVFKKYNGFPVAYDRPHIMANVIGLYAEVKNGTRFSFKK